MASVALLLGVEEVPQELIDKLHKSIRRKLRVRRVHDVRIDSLHSSEDDFRDQAYRDPHGLVSEGFEDRIINRQMTCLTDAFGRYSLHDVVVIVYGPRSSEDDLTRRWEWVTGLIYDSVPAYQVHESESNPSEFYMSGSGFGNTIEVALR